MDFCEIALCCCFSIYRHFLIDFSSNINADIVILMDCYIYVIFEKIVISNMLFLLISENLAPFTVNLNYNGEQLYNILKNREILQTEWIFVKLLHCVAEFKHLDV